MILAVNDVHLPSVTLCWRLEIGHRVSIYTMGISRHYPSGLPLSPPPPKPVYQHIIVKFNP